jgi:DNA-directed RNA polymerase alpha subunit
MISVFGGLILTKNKNLRICEEGHTYYISSDCPSYPVCNQENKPKSGFLSKLSSLVSNALLREGIDILQKLSNYTEKEILKLHGIGPTSIPVMRKCLEEEGLSFINK